MSLAILTKRAKTGRNLQRNGVFSLNGNINTTSESCCSRQGGPQRSVSSAGTIARSILRNGYNGLYLTSNTMPPKKCCKNWWVQDPGIYDYIYFIKQANLKCNFRSELQLYNNNTPESILQLSKQNNPCCNTSRIGSRLFKNIPSKFYANNYNLPQSDYISTRYLAKNNLPPPANKQAFPFSTSNRCGGVNYKTIQEATNAGYYQPENLNCAEYNLYHNLAIN